jgi:hypothetical protein
LSADIIAKLHRTGKHDVIDVIPEFARTCSGTFAAIRRQQAVIAACSTSESPGMRARFQAD